MEMWDSLVDLGNWLWGWYGDPDNQNRSNAIITAATFLLAILGIILTPIWWLFKKRPKSSSGTPAPVQPIITMTLDDFNAKLDERENQVRKALETASDEEIEVLTNQLAELQRQKQNPNDALTKAQDTIARLESALSRESNQISADRLIKARAALEAGDYSLADDIFKEIENRNELEIKSTARAAFGRGEIAEAEIRWHDAATHYARAARLDPTYDHLIKAGIFLGRAGHHKQALPIQQDLVDLAQDEFGDADPKTATALNNLAQSLQALGDLDGAEPLMRRAMEINKNPLGDDHTAYATDLNNLAQLLLAKGDLDGAEPLMRRAMDIDKNALGEDHTAYATDLNNLAQL